MYMYIYVYSYAKTTPFTGRVSGLRIDVNRYKLTHWRPLSSYPG